MSKKAKKSKNISRQRVDLLKLHKNRLVCLTELYHFPPFLQKHYFPCPGGRRIQPEYIPPELIVHYLAPLVDTNASWTFVDFRGYNSSSTFVDTNTSLTFVDTNTSLTFVDTNASSTFVDTKAGEIMRLPPHRFFMTYPGRKENSKLSLSTCLCLSVWFSVEALEG